MYTEAIDTEAIVQHLFKGKNPQQVFAQTFNESLKYQTTGERVGDDDFEVLTKPKNNRLTPISENYTPNIQQPIQKTQTFSKKSPLAGVLPPEIIESYRGRDEYGGGGSILEGLANSISSVQPQSVIPKQQYVQPSSYDKDNVIRQLVEDVQKLKEKVKINESSSSNNISLTVEGKEYSGRIVQNKKSGNIMFIVDDKHCFVLTPEPGIKTFTKK